MSTFAVSVTQRPQMRLYGIPVRTSMAEAATDCSHLWEKVFAPRMHEISGKKPCEYHGPSYGISVMIDASHFEYWAAMPAPEGLPLPQGMRQIEIPAGFYAGCVLSGLAQLGEAYTYLCEAWPKTTKEYALNMQAPCFEHYDQTYCESGALAVYAPLLRV